MSIWTVRPRWLGGVGTIFILPVRLHIGYRKRELQGFRSRALLQHRVYLARILKKIEKRHVIIMLDV